MTGIPILDTILDLIMQYRLGFAMMGLAVVAVALLLRPVAPDWSANNRRAVAIEYIHRFPVEAYQPGVSEYLHGSSVD